MSFSIFQLDRTVVGNAPGHCEDVKDLPYLPKEARIELAHQAWKDEEGKLSIKGAARQFGVSYTILWNRIHGCILKALASQAMQ